MGYGGDPYKYDDVDVMKNKLHIKDADELERAESTITRIETFQNILQTFGEYILLEKETQEQR